MWTYVVVAVVTAVIVSVAWILLLRKVMNNASKEFSQEFEEELKDQEERRKREVDREINYREEQEKEWREGRKENILESMEALFKMFLFGYKNAGVPTMQAFFKAVRDSIYFASIVTYTGGRVTGDFDFRTVFFDDNELFEHLSEKFPDAFKDFTLKDFYTKSEKKDREDGIFYRDGDEEWNIVKKLTAKYES